ncbi:hypothetical protein RHSIM_Rhsim03G0097400 [Rhododendron simsii]|uniref:MULE transposase domain-containing protein n=1 Tax=Rhododendron simsii TaxID=118357 RepID=A0A834H8A1_RHOSS|nr:hypothetical protein RHSIM_Rhsim03G0097400 [Rhododendron simsii]
MKKALISMRRTPSEEEQIGVTDDVNVVEQSSLQASDGEALISSLLKTRTMMTEEEEEISVAVEIEPVEQSCLHLPVKKGYGLFGDAICFDTRFRTNNYDMLCPPIVGINNHGQTTLFGCGLLDGETTDAVTWLFTTFLEAMGGKKPVSIFTDQSRAIANAIHAMFPDSHHGLCIWHIYQNAAKH